MATTEANSINAATTGIVGNTGTGFTGTAATQYNVIVGGSTSSTLSNVAPSSTSGVPLVSAGAASNPSFGTAVVAGGGTGLTSATAYSPICGGTTTTGALQSASTGQSTSGFVLTSTGASSLPSFQTVSASGALTTITGNSGGAESPSSGNFNILGTGSITVAGTANTETVQLTGLTNHNVLIGAGTATITKVAPSATSGVPLISGGASADPSFGTVVVAGGGTGITSTTAYSPICGGTTTTGALQAASTGQSTSGFVLTSTGASSLPTWQAAAGGVTTINGNSGSATGSTITFSAPTSQGSAAFSGSSSTVTLNFSDSSLATCLGTNAGHIGTNSGRITALGYNALNGQTSSNYNTAIGAYAMGNNTAPGVQNTAVGDSSGYSLNAGTDNSSYGYASGGNITSGNFNTCIGSRGGENYASSESNNIAIGAQGTASESNVLRIGNSTGTGTRQLNKAVICGINGITVSGTAVLVSSSDQLGIAVSSRRFKENIQDMGDVSSSIYSLRPVKYNPKGDSSTFCTGLIAEEVDEKMPHLVHYDQDGSALTVKYHELPALLLNELKKLKAEVEDLKKQVSGCKK